MYIHKHPLPRTHSKLIHLTHTLLRAVRTDPTGNPAQARLTTVSDRSPPSDHGVNPRAVPSPLKAYLTSLGVFCLLAMCSLCAVVLQWCVTPCVECAFSQPSCFLNDTPIPLFGGCVLTVVQFVVIDYDLLCVPQWTC